MRMTMKKLTQGATRLLVLALGLGLASTGWAAASLEETGVTVPTTATLAFKGATLSQVTADTLSGVMGGDWAGAVAGNAMTFNNFDRTSEASGTITCQAQVQHDTNVKGVLLTFTQDGANVKVTKTGAKYISGTVGQSIAGGTDGYYDVSKLKLTLTRVVPNVCWVENFPSSQTTVDGVTLNPLNGSSTVTDGIITYGTPGNANGPAFSFSAAGYVAVVFTVDFTGVTLAANQILFTLGNSSNNGLVGAALKSNGSGGFYATGIWVDGAWTTADDSSNTFTLSGEQTFLAIYNKGEDAATKGTHLYVLDNGVAKVLYGGTSGIGLKGGDVTKLGIGGAFGSSGSFTNMPGLKLKKVAIYLSSSSLPMVASNLPAHSYMAKFAVANGETINASTINAGVTTFGSAYVSTEAGATINLDAELNGHTITFDGSISGVPGSADGLTLGSANDKVTLTDASYVPVIKGRGTVVYPDNTIPSSDSTGWLTSSDWAGTLSLNNIQGANNTQPGWYTPFHNYGSANSTIKVSGFTGFFGAGNFESSATLEIAAGSTFTLNNGNNGNSMTFAKLKGSGDIVICGNNSPAIQYVMRDASEFAGNITVSQSGTLKKSIVLGGGSSYNYNVNNYQKQICVLGNVTIAAGKTWTADNGIVVNGTLTKADSTATLSGTITGSGKIVYNDELPNSADFTANTWTGTVEVNGGATTAAGIVAADAAQFMNSSAKFTVASGTVTLGTIAGLTGKVNVKSGATLQIVDGTTTTKYLTLAETSGNLNLAGCTALATLTLDLGRNRDSSIVYPSSLKTLQLILDENLADDTELTFNVGNGTTLEAATVTVYKPDGSTVNNTAAAEVSADGHSVKVTYSPTVDGSAAWCAYEFASNLNNSGSDTTSLSPDGSFSATTSVDGDGKLYTYSHPYRSITYPADGNWSAMVRCTVPKLAEAIVVTFGTRGAGLIGLAAGATPDSEMYLVQTTNGGGSYDSHYVTNAVMSVLNGTTAQHVYVFTVANNQTVKIYCDNELIETKVFDSPFTIGSGIQIGSIHGGIGSVGLHACRADGTAADPAYSALSEADQKAARVDSMRLYKGVLGPNAIAQLSEEFPAVKLFEATISGGNANVWGSLGWTGGDISTINAYSKAIITVEDDATLTLPASIAADELVFNIVSGKTLTLDQGSGVTLALGHPVEVNGGSIAFSTTDIKLGSSVNIGGTGTVTLGNGMVVNETLSGNAKVEIPSGSTVAVMGGSIANQITGSGVLAYMALPSSALSFSSWTGTVQLPAIASGGIIFNNYGTTGSTVYLTSMSSGAWIDPSYTTINPKLYLAGNMTLAAMSTRTYTFAEIDGSGDLSFATSGDQPTAINITKVAEGYTGTISSTLANPVTIATLDREAGTSTAGGTKLLSTSGNVVANALTVEGVAQQVGLCTAADGIYVACTVTIPEVANASATVTVGGVAAEGSSPYTVDVGSNVEITWTADSGYKITAGATQTINAIATDVTATAPTVEAKGATVSDVSVSYGADYASATVTATISDTTLDYYISWSSGEPVKGSVSGSQVTFDVSGINHTTEYQSAGYTITAKDGETAVTTTGGSGTSVAADTTPWFSQSSANSGAPVGGSWATAVNLSTPTNVTDNTFEATSPSTSSRVVLEFKVCFSSTSEEDVSGEAQAAIKLAEVNSVTTFMVLTNGNNWAAVSNAELTPNASATYKVVLTIDYGDNAYGVTVGNYVMTNSAGVASFPLAANRSSVQNIDFAGSGTLTSLKGDQVEGYMVVDNNGKRYPTIAAAIAAYNADPTIGPLKVLHAGTAPSGWRIDGDTLIKAAKGLFFMAF